MWKYLSHLFICLSIIIFATPIFLQVDELIADLKNHPGIGVDLAEVTADEALPPASLQSFLKAAKVPGLVITDHEKEFRNKSVEKHP